MMINNPSTRTAHLFPLIGISLILFFLSGCGSSYPAPGVDGKKYQYVYQLVEPFLSPKMEFQDHRISISFSIDDAAISYTILNLKPELMNVESGGAMIGIDDNYFPVRNSQSLYSDSSCTFSPLIIPQRGYLNDLIIPRMNIYWDDEEEEWIEKDLFPTLDSGLVSVRSQIAQQIGRRMTVILPVTVEGTRKEYQFTFKVAAIKIVSPDAPMQVRQRPPAPKD